MDINDAASSKVHLKIIAFFHENQASIDTPRGVATWIGEDRAKVKQALGIPLSVTGKNPFFDRKVQATFLEPNESPGIGRVRSFCPVRCEADCHLAGLAVN